MEILKVTQENCKGCRDLDFMLENMELEVDKVINLTTCSDEDKAYALDKLKVMGTPQLFLIDGDEVVQQIAGVNIGAIQQMFDSKE